MAETRAAFSTESLSNDELVAAYSQLTRELKKRGIVRSKNIVGDLGEYIAINVYNSRRNLPKLQLAPGGTQNVDALSRDGDRYSIKTVTHPNRVTGVFWGMEALGSSVPDNRNFEHVIITILDENMKLVELVEIDWKTFIKLKRWHSRMKAWNLSVTDELRKNASRIIKA